MSEWKECTIADLGEIVGGATRGEMRAKRS